MSNTKVSLLVCGIVALMLASCRSTPRRPQHAELPYERLVIVQFADQPPYSNEGDRFTRLVSEKILQAGAEVDPVVVKPSEVGISSVPELLRKGAIPLDVLRKAAKDCNADAIMIGEITSFNAYSDPAISVTIKVFDVADATMISSVNNRWDAASPEVKNAIEEYYEEFKNRSECRFGPHLMTTSPRYFLFFVAHELVWDHLSEVRVE